MGAQKRLVEQMFGASSNRVPLAMLEMTFVIRPALVYRYCLLLGHNKSTYKRAFGLCFQCSAIDH